MSTIRDKSDTEYFEWSPEDEIQLFFAMDGLRPVGINRHFFIACIVERLSKALNRDISSEAVWSHLKTMYNLKALEEQEQLPFPNDEVDFALPESEYSSGMKQKTIEEQVMEESKKLETKSDSSIKSAKDKEPIEKEKDKQPEKSSKNSSVDSTPKRPQKRTRGSMSLEPSTASPASTPPNVQSTKRRRI